MKNRTLRILLAALSIPVLVVGCSDLNNSSPANGEMEPILASGVIEADQINIAAELPGRIAEVYYEEGAQVSTDDPLLRLDDDLLLAQKEQALTRYNLAVSQQESANAALGSARAMLAAAEASLDAAEIQLEQVLLQVYTLEGEERVGDWNESSPSQIDLPAWYFQQPENITAAQNILDLARDDYQTELDNYQQLARDIGSEDFLKAEQRLADAQAAFQVADALQDRSVGYSESDKIKDEIDAFYDSAETELESAQKAFDQILSDSAYEDLLEGRARVSVARERYDLARDYLADQYTGIYSLEVQGAEALVAGAEAGVLQAQAGVDLAALDEISSSLLVEQAKAEVEILELQIEKLEIRSPLSGVILSRSAEPGEVIAAGYTLMTIGDLDSLTVTVYLPENRYGQVSLGDPAELTVDSYPDTVLEAEIIYISDQAEYTPRNVQTQEERQNTVYAVKLKVDNTSGILKPGMPADVVFNP